MRTEIDENRFSLLFDLASGKIAETSPTLTPEEEAEVNQLRALLDAIDNSWKAAPSELDKVRAQFLEKLAAREPSHPWVTESTVNTLGELVQISGDDVPDLPTEVYQQLIHDSTSIDDLLDSSRRTSMIGQAVKNAHIPQNSIGEFMLWVNRTMTALFPLPGAAQPRYVFTRKQGKRRGSD